MKHASFAAFLPLALALLVAGCGSASSQSVPTPTDVTGSHHSGDISDTANYLTYQGHGYKIKYVEGWSTQQGPGTGVTISDKDSAEVVAVTSGSGNIATYASANLNTLAHSLPKYHLVLKQSTPLAAGQAVHAQYRTLSPPDTVTGKRVPVIVDRYYVAGQGKRAVITLQTPVGVDNVDAFRLIAHSFRWA